MQQEHLLITYPTWKKYIVISRMIDMLRVKDKRLIFQTMRRTDDLSHDTFFPHYGITAGDFAVWQILSEQKKTAKAASQTKSRPVASAVASSPECTL